VYLSVGRRAGWKLVHECQLLMLDKLEKKDQIKLPVKFIAEKLSFEFTWISFMSI
jgi:hypothetical protein